MQSFMTIWQYYVWSLISTTCGTKVEKRGHLITWRVGTGHENWFLIISPARPKFSEVAPWHFANFVAQHIIHCWRLSFIFFTFSFPITCTFNQLFVWRLFFLKYFLRVLQLLVSSILTPRLPFPRPPHLRKQQLVVWEGSTRADNDGADLWGGCLISSPHIWLDSLSSPFSSYSSCWPVCWFCRARELLLNRASLHNSSKVTSSVFVKHQLLIMWEF